MNREELKDTGRKMKRYKLKQDIPAFKAGEVFYLSDAGNLFRESDNVPVYGWTIIDKNPNILTDWFEEIKESTHWKPEKDETYYFITNDGKAMDDMWFYDSGVDHNRFEIGNLFKTEEEAKKVAEYLKALAVVRGDATTEFTRGNRNWYVYYGTDMNSLRPWFNINDNRNGIFGLPYFATREDAQRSIERHKKEWLTIFGIEGPVEEEE